MGQIKYFTQKELNKLFSTIKKQSGKQKYWLRDLALIRVAYRCGLRVSEVGLLKLSHLNMLTRELYCTRLKNSQNNTIRLDDGTFKVLSKYIKEYNITEDNNLLFISQKKSPLSRFTLHHKFFDYCKLAKLTDESKFHFHALKRSIAVHLAEAGLDIKELQFYLGHKNVNNTLIYYQFTTKQQDVMYAKIRKSKELL